MPLVAERKTLVTERRERRKILDKLPDLEARQRALEEEWSQLEMMRQELAAKIQVSSKAVQEAKGAQAFLMHTSCISKAEYTLSNEVSEHFMKVKPRLLKGTTEEKRTIEAGLKVLYSKRDQAAKVRLDPEQCVGGKNFWEPPKEDGA